MAQHCARKASAPMEMTSASSARNSAITCGAKAKHAAPTASMETPPSAEVNSMALRTRPKRAAP